MKMIAPYVQRSDARGRLQGLLNEGRWEEMNYLETRAGETRGNHLHRHTREIFFIIDGEIEVVTQRPGEATQRAIVRGGDVFEIEPGEIHTFHCKTDTRWINILSQRFDDAAPDLVPGIPE